MLEEAIREINRGTAEIIDIERIEKLLKAYYEDGKTYTVKAGFDLHLLPYFYRRSNDLYRQK